MASSRKSTKRRLTFIATCQNHLNRLSTMEQYLRAGHAAKAYLTGTSGRQITPTMTVFPQLPSVDPDIETLRSLTHALVIQEWHIYLDDSFEKAILHSMEKGTATQVQRMIVDLGEIVWRPVRHLRRSLAEHLRESFSFLSYDEKIKNLEQLYTFESIDQTRMRMKTHIVVRNVLQHNRGVIRSEDLKRLGLKILDLRDDQGATRQLNVGDAIKLTYRDVEELVSIAEAHSKDFEVVK